MCVVVVGVEIVGAGATAVPVPVVPGGVDAVDDPQPAAIRAAPRSPSADALFRVLSILIHYDA